MKKTDHVLSLFNAYMGMQLAANQALNWFLNNEKSSHSH